MNKMLRLLILLLFCSGFAAHTMAQKAYETAIYNTEYQGYNITLLWADGYMGASEIWLSLGITKQEPDKFYPRDGEPDEKGQLFFQSIKENDSRAFRLTGISQQMGLPAVIKGKFFNGHEWVPVSLKLTRKPAVLQHKKRQ